MIHLFSMYNSPATVRNEIILNNSSSGIQLTDTQHCVICKIKQNFQNRKLQYRSAVGRDKKQRELNDNMAAII